MTETQLPYEIKKQGKINILVVANKEYRIGDEINNNYCNVVIVNITPKQVHYRFVDGWLKDKTFKPNTWKFIHSFQLI